MLLEDANYTSVWGALNLKDIGSDLLDGTTKANELRFTLRRWNTAYAVDLVHRDAADLARYGPLVGHLHCEFERHAVIMVTDDTAPRERHIEFLSDRRGSRMACCPDCVDTGLKAILQQ
jgi:hypothetical protein